MRVKSAVVGLGWVGRKHLETYTKLSNVQTVGVCDSNESLAREVAEEAGVPFWTDARKLLDEARPDVVSLCTPPASHLPNTEDCAGRGIHTLVEKPMASTVEQCDRMIEVCSKAGTTLMIAHKKRFLPVVQRLKELTQSELGEIKFCIYRYPHGGLSQKDWFWDEDDGGGPILENACHATDLLRYLIGDVVRVYAEGANLYAKERAPQIDGATFTLKFRNGAIACAGAGMISMPGFSDEYFFGTTELGALEMWGSFDSPTYLRYALRSKPDHPALLQASDDAFELEIEHFLQCCADGRDPVTNGEEGREAVRICRAIKESASTAKPIRIEEW